MSRFPDWKTAPEASDIMERIAEKFPEVFEGLDIGAIDFIETMVKNEKSMSIRLHARTHPDIALHPDKPYIVETYDKNWEAMDQKCRNLAIFHVMCAIPVGGTDPESKFFAKKVQPDIKMYTREFAVCGGVPNWMENPAARDPLVTPGAGQSESTEGNGPSIVRNPVTRESIAKVA